MVLQWSAGQLALATLSSWCIFARGINCSDDSDYSYCQKRAVWIFDTHVLEVCLIGFDNDSEFLLHGPPHEDNTQTEMNHNSLTLSLVLQKNGLPLDA